MVSQKPVFGKPTLQNPNLQHINTAPLESPLAQIAGSAKSTILSPSEVNKLFDDCIKITTDNKINAKNSWNLALIDFFYELNLLKDGDSINFQKASCTLDGCIKIYASRLDSVDSDSKRLLSGLAHNSEDGDHMLEDDSGQAIVKKAKKVHTAGNTLEKDFTALNLKKFDLDYDVDPLFKKTSADFDEGGARGLLLNHLCIGDNCQIIFDSSSVPEIEVNDKENNFMNQNVDISKIRESLNSLWTRDICPSLKSFKFNSLDAAPFDPQALFESTHDMFKFDAAVPNDIDDNVASDDGAGQDFIHQSGFGFMDDDPNVNGNVIMQQGGDAIQNILVEMQADKAISQSNRMEEEGGDLIFTQTGAQDLLLFDGAKNKNWIGPEHWRPSRNIAASKKVVDKDAADEAPKRKKAVVVPIDFDAPPVDLQVLFETGKISINLPKSGYSSNNLLPKEDHHFDANRITSLFLRPKYKLSWQKRDGSVRENVSALSNDSMANGGELEKAVDPEIEFWVDRQDDVAIFQEALDISAAPVNIEEVVEDYYGGDDDSDNEAMAEGMSTLAHNLDRVSLDYGEQLVIANRKNQSQQLQYSRVAKKVDVKRLKDNIWKRISSETKYEKKDESSHCKFTTIIQGLDTLYPEKKLKDISVAFCFICLLHLANEQGLEIEMDRRDMDCGNMNELSITI